MNELTQELAARITEDVRSALLEDIGSGDLTAALVPETQQARASVIVREDAVICGAPWFEEVFRQFGAGIEITWYTREGQLAHAGSVVCELAGPARPLLTGERVALNFLQTLSGTATAARAFKLAVASAATTILDTRKTLPGLRLAQKYAVKVGGARNHRVGLYDGILIKENHITACGGVREAVVAALSSGNDVLIEVEVESLTQAREAMEAGAQRLLLDNFELDTMRSAVQLRDEGFADITLEASGGITLINVAAVAETGVDFISVGSMTKDVRATDFSMRFEML